MAADFSTRPADSYKSMSAALVFEVHFWLIGCVSYVARLVVSMTDFHEVFQDYFEADRMSGKTQDLKKYNEDKPVDDAKLWAFNYLS